METNGGCTPRCPVVQHCGVILLFMTDVVYADFNSTTPLDARVLDSMMPYLTSVFHNASSVHSGGLLALQAVIEARMAVSRELGARFDEIVFTSGATESINLSLLGSCAAARSQGSSRNRVVTSCTEHPAVLHTTSRLVEDGWDVVTLGVDSDGLVDAAEAKRVINDSTLIVCLMAVNNETGVIQDLPTIAEITHEVGALFMTDATQAFGKYAINVDNPQVDLLAFSGHKIYGPKGVGGLYVRKRGLQPVSLQPLIYGGKQESGLRSGTLNVPGIVGLAKATTIMAELRSQESERIKQLRDHFESLMTQLSGVSANSASAPRSYNVSNLCLGDMDAELILSEVPHIACSKGSACSTGTPQPSHVLTAMGLDTTKASASVRFSFGRTTTREHIEAIVESISPHIINNQKLISNES